MGLFDLSRIYNKQSKPILISTKNVLDFTRKRISISFLSFTTAAIDPFKKLTLGGEVDLWLIPVRHTVETYGIKVKAKKPIFYAPEFRSIPGPSKKYLGDLDVLIIDGSSKSSIGQSIGHQNIEEGIKVAQQLQPKKVYFTNIGHKTDIHYKLEGFVRKNGGNKFNIAFDGLELKL